MFGVFSGLFWISSFVALSLKLWLLGYFDLDSLLFIMPVLSYGLIIIFGNLVVLSASMSIEWRGILAFLMFLSSVFAIFGSVLFLVLGFLGPLGS
jgi:hypothetical protein